jgi:hypothetical protein
MKKWTYEIIEVAQNENDGLKIPFSVFTGTKGPNDDSESGRPTEE